ncbi:MAG: hypothetical protein AAF674_18460 [Pseudomonadota bacterium]
MSNSVFDTFDMVVALSQKTINDQLAQLQRLGSIQDTFYLYRTVDDKGDYHYTAADTKADVPGLKDGATEPSVECLLAYVAPRVELARSGTDVSFVLTFPKGEAWLYRGGRLFQHDMSGWSYAIDIDLNLAEIAKEDIAKNKGIPEQVQQQLTDFSTRDFTVNNLFIDFNSVDLVRFDPAGTKAGDAGEMGMQALALFMQFYLTNQQKEGNPYILGYSLTTTSKTQFKDSEKVPASLRPVGATFSVTHNPKNPELSTLNFLIDTEGGSGPIIKSKTIFEDQWLTKADGVDGKAIFSHKRLAIPLLLEPFYNNLKDSVWDKISGHIDVNSGHSFADGSTAVSNGFNFTISAQNGDDNKYYSSYVARFDSAGGEAQIDYEQGYLRLYKEKSKGLLFCTARAHIDGTVNWMGKTTLSAILDADGKAVLKPNSSPIQVNKPYPDWSIHKNSCAKDWSAIGSIFGKILDGLLTFGQTNFFEDLLSNALDVKIDSFGDVTAALANVGNVSNVVYLPAGGVFDFRDPAFNGAGDLSLGLTYKSQH